MINACFNHVTNFMDVIIDEHHFLNLIHGNSLGSAQLIGLVSQIKEDTHPLADSTNILTCISVQLVMTRHECVNT